MNSSVSALNAISKNEPEYREQHRARVDQFVKKQHPVVRGLHRVLQGLSLLLLANAIICYGVALYHTVLWVFTGSLTLLGAATYLPDAWINFGLSMSLMVFPWGLDSMLLRAFPAVIFPLAWHRSDRPIPFMTGLPAFFGGFGIMCAGAPGAAYFTGLASQALQKFF